MAAEQVMWMFADNRQKHREGAKEWLSGGRAD